ncbi:hypothetical protein Zmor_004976 [Zophobas morio]|uniref:Uncharacterized protein n=1 Tax=Zophobas morio TaxID=2755281 RepID=A0AA38MLX9_9CUCU|nr:hypothetical protein Zmor_004976 [Zophobas morio]
MYSIESLAFSVMNDYKILCKNWLYERRLFLLVLQIVIIGIYTVGLKIKNTTKRSKKKTKSVTDSPICKPVGVDNIFWLNKIIENIWTSDRRNIESWITTNLAPHIPSSVQLVDFQLGNKHRKCKCHSRTKNFDGGFNNSV